MLTPSRPCATILFASKGYSFVFFVLLDKAVWGFSSYRCGPSAQKCHREDLALPLLQTFAKMPIPWPWRRCRTAREAGGPSLPPLQTGSNLKAHGLVENVAKENSRQSVAAEVDLYRSEDLSKVRVYLQPLWSPLSFGVRTAEAQDQSLKLRSPSGVDQRRTG